MGLRWYKSKIYHIILLVIIIFFLLLHFGREEVLDEYFAKRALLIFKRNSFTKKFALATDDALAYDVIPDKDALLRSSIVKDVERRLAEALKEDKGTGCQIPKIDPFDEEIMKYNDAMPKVVCQGFDWVRCHLSECRVRDEILQSYEQVRCKYQDILFISDQVSRLGLDHYTNDEEVYHLVKSDHVKVTCTGLVKEGRDRKLPTSWSGYALGYRTDNFAETDKKSEGNDINVLILGYDSTSKNGFIRRMPKSYEVLTQDTEAVILNGYNILGDGTPAALFPILTGLTELELPDRRRAISKAYLDDFPFIFFKLRELGFRTAYFEDSPNIGTFQYRFNGFSKQPADHYLRHFYTRVNEDKSKIKYYDMGEYCVGDTPSYLLMLNATEEFFELPARKFIFTFIVDITHDNFNMITTADDDFAEWLRRFKLNGHLDNTLLFVMGDHGPRLRALHRFGTVRNTLPGKLEERLPLLAIRIPEKLKKARPDIQSILEGNVDVLTTAHDFHATIVDALGLKEVLVNTERGQSLFRPISSNRSCSEAGIERHWCTCLKWSDVSSSEQIYPKVGAALVEYIYSLTEPQREQCVPRILKTIEYVQRRLPDKQLLKFSAARDKDGYLGKFDANIQIDKEVFSVKITVGPGHGVYEASMIYIKSAEKFEIDAGSISRINAYNDEPHCISATNPHLNKYCYCKDIK